MQTEIELLRLMTQMLNLIETVIQLEWACKDIIRALPDVEALREELSARMKIADGSQISPSS